MRSVRFIFLALLLFASSASGQTIRGFVVSGATKEPIGAASVELRDSADARIIGELTHVNGEFRMPRRERAVTLYVHALGYFDTTLTLPLADSIIALRINPHRSNEITVTALRHTASEQEVPISTAVVTQAEALSRSPMGLDNVLRYIPGVSVTESEINIRGSSGYARGIGSRVLLLLDGMPFFSADNGDPKFDALPLFDIDRVEVVKGPGSALYGSNALGGVINVITREPTATSHTAIQTFAGMYDEPKYASWQVPSLKRRYYSIEGGTSTTVNDVGLLGSVGYKRNEGYRLGDDSYRWQAFGKATTVIGGSSKASLEVLAANENHGGWIYWKGLSNPLLPPDSTTAVNARTHSNKENVIAAVTSTLSESVTSTIKASYLRTAYTTDPDSAGAPVGIHSTANLWNADGTVNASINANLFLTAGASASLPYVASDLYSDHHGINYAAFAQAEIHALRNLIVTAGLREDGTKYDNMTANYQLSPKLGFSYELVDGWSLRGSVGTGFRAPSIAERFIDGVVSGFPLKPNIGLLPERNRSAEFGTSIKNNLLNIDGAIFYSTFDDLIEPSFIKDSTLAIQFRNITKASMFGHEETIEVYPFETNDLMLRVGYTYVYPENTTTKQVLEFRPRHLLQSRIEGNWKNITASTDFRYISKYEALDSTLILFVPNADARVNAYIWDAQIGYSLKDVFSVPLDISFQVQNILNYYYVEISGNLAPLRNYTLRLETQF